MSAANGNTSMVLLKAEPVMVTLEESNSEKSIYAASQRTSCFFIGVLAPDPNSACDYLASAPPASFVLVHYDNKLWIYGKFRFAIRAVMLLNSKEMKKNNTRFEWHQTPNPNRQACEQTEGQQKSDPNVEIPINDSIEESNGPISRKESPLAMHQMFISMNAYVHLERVWLKFMPSLQVFAFELARKPYYYEDLPFDRWQMKLESSEFPCVIQLTNNSTTTCVTFEMVHLSQVKKKQSVFLREKKKLCYPIRQVKFDFVKQTIQISDGFLNPNAFILSTTTHFPSKKTFDNELTFSLVKKNFLHPTQVLLKEEKKASSFSSSNLHSTKTIMVNTSEYDDCDQELQLFHSIVMDLDLLVPNQPLPDKLLDLLKRLHLHLCKEEAKKKHVQVENSSSSTVTPSITIENSGASISTTVSPIKVGTGSIDCGDGKTSATHCSKAKTRLVNRLLLHLVEFLAATCANVSLSSTSSNSGSRTENESNEEDDKMASFSSAAQPSEITACQHFAKALRLCIVFLVQRCEDDPSTIYRLLHKLIEHLGSFCLAKHPGSGAFLLLLTELASKMPIVRNFLLRNDELASLWLGLSLETASFFTCALDLALSQSGHAISTVAKGNRTPVGSSNSATAPLVRASTESIGAKPLMIKLQARKSFLKKIEHRCSMTIGQLIRRTSTIGSRRSMDAKTAKEALSIHDHWSSIASDASTSSIASVAFISRTKATIEAAFQSSAKYLHLNPYSFQRLLKYQLQSKDFATPFEFHGFSSNCFACSRCTNLCVNGSNGNNGENSEFLRGNDNEESLEEDGRDKLTRQEQEMRRAIALASQATIASDSSHLLGKRGRRSFSHRSAAMASESGLEDWMCLDLNSFTPGSALYLLILELSLYLLKNVPVEGSPTLPMSITLRKMQAWKTKADRILELRDLYDGIHIQILSVTKESMQSDASQRANHTVCTLERLWLLVSVVYRLEMKARHIQRQIQLQIDAFHAVIAINDPTKGQDPLKDKPYLPTQTIMQAEKYFRLLYLFRHQLRCFRDSIERRHALAVSMNATSKSEQVMSDFVAPNSVEYSSASSSACNLDFAGSEDQTEMRFFLKMIVEFLSRMPNSLINQFVLVCIEDFMEICKTLKKEIKIQQKRVFVDDPKDKTKSLILDVRLLLESYGCLMKRASDADLQKLLFYLLSETSSNFSLEFFVQFFINHLQALSNSNTSSSSSSSDTETDKNFSCSRNTATKDLEEVDQLKMDLSVFFEAFVTLDLNLSSRQKLSSVQAVLNQQRRNSHENLGIESSMNNGGTDVEDINEHERIKVEQRKLQLWERIVKNDTAKATNDEDEGEENSGKATKGSLSIWDALLSFLNLILSGDHISSSSMTLHLLSSEKTRNSTRQAAHVQTTASLLYLLLKLYSSIPEHFQQKISFEKCVSYHFQHVEFLRQYYTQLNHEKTGSNANASNPGGSECNGSFSSSSNAIDHKISTWWLCDLMELHMKCLIALAERRKKFPSIERTFRKLQILPLFVSRLLRISRNLVEKAQKKTAEGTINSTISLESEVKTFVPMLSLGGGKKEIRVLPNELENHDEEDDEYTNYKQQKNTYQEANRVISITVSNSLAFSSAGDKIDHVSSATHLDLARLTVPRGSNDVGPKCRSNVALNQRDILEKDMKLHALAVALVLVYITLEPRHTLDPILCPRFFGTDNGTGIPSGFEKVDLLWSLQQHLVTMKASIPSIICVFSELDLCDFLGAQKVEVVRIMLRLLCQSSFDRNFYAVTISKGSNVEQRLQAFNAHQGGNRALVRSTEEEENTRKYLAKGAFSVVYQAIPSRPNTFPVAIKAIKFQKIPGDRSVVHDLFNEVTLLRKLQGNSAAVQMLDFGASEEHQVFEIVTEFCPCTLKEWRQQIEVNPKINNLSITSKSKVLLACLRVFRHTCVALQQIHDDGIVHLDIKCENVFSRSDVQDLTEHTLLSSTTQGSEGNVICFGDFGESIEVELMAVQQDDIENSREVAYLTRSHGTEAIKSPEMLQVKGGLGVDAKEYVTATSDIWSLGCLLYELVTQEFMFVRDNWARFYTHLVKSNDKILRTDHEEKLLDALGWTSEDIQMDPIIGQCFHGLCKFMSSCMTRQPKDRPSIHQLILELDLLIQQVTSLAGSSSDKFNDSGSFSRPSSSA